MKNNKLSSTNTKKYEHTESSGNKSYKSDGNAEGSSQRKQKSTSSNSSKNAIKNVMDGLNTRTAYLSAIIHKNSELIV